MKSTKTIFIFISEEGFGHVVRICSIINEYYKITKQKLDIHIFTGSHILLLETRLKIPVKIHVINSGLLLRKNHNCSLDTEATLYNLIDWHNQLSTWKNQIISCHQKCDLIISDSVPQAGMLSPYYKCKSINLSHFTWDWMYEEINARYKYKSIKGVNESINTMKELYDYYDLFIFPPLTPNNNLVLLESRSRKYVECSFILSDSFIEAFYSNSSWTVRNVNLPKLLLMNNGTSSLTECINNIICNWSDKYNINLLVSPAELGDEALANIVKSTTIYPLQTISQAHSAINYVQYFLARCGYNTLTESIFTKAHPILVAEESNPEIESNLDYASIREMKIIQPKDISTDKIISIANEFSCHTINNNKSLAINKELLLKGRIECVEIIASYLH